MVRKTLLCMTLFLLACSGSDDAGDPDGAPTDGPASDAAESDPRWQLLPEVGLGAVQEIGVAELDGRIYVVGGFNGLLGLLEDVQVYDIEAGTWSTVAPLPRSIHHANVAAVDGKLYVLGSLIDLQFTATGESWVYDPVADSWSDIAPMGAAAARGASALGVVDGKIYVAGGFRAGQAVDDFSVYDPVADSWDHNLPSIPGPRDHLVAAAVGGLFYAISGRNGSIGNLQGRVDAYDPVAGSWSERAAILTPRGGMAAGVVDGQILVVGGEGAPNPTGVFAEVESYDPVADTWTSLGTMRTPRHGMGAAGYQGTLYVPGGADRQAFAAVATFEAFTPGE